MYPTHDRRMRYQNTALGHHGDQITVAELVGDVPPHAQNDDLGIELSFEKH